MALAGFDEQPACDDRFFFLDSISGVILRNSDADVRRKLGVFIFGLGLPGAAHDRTCFMSRDGRDCGAAF